MKPKIKKPTHLSPRYIVEGESKFCKRCDSTVKRNGFLGLFGELLCVNPECKNSQSKKIYYKL